MNPFFWTGYLGTQGWASFGPSIPPPTDTPERFYVAIACLAEAPRGCPGAINMYDSCVLSIGYIQLCQKYHLATELLSYLSDHGIPQLYSDSLQASKVSLSQGRLYSEDGKLVEDYRDVFYAGSNGKAWTSKQREHALRWGQGIQDTLILPEAVPLQIDFLASRIHQWVSPRARRILWNSNGPWAEPIRAAYLSYAINNPSLADRNLPDSLPLTEEGFTTLLPRLILLGPTFYPGRYAAIASKLADLTGLPIPNLTTLTKHIQKIVGVANDGVIGPVTRAAFNRYIGGTGGN